MDPQQTSSQKHQQKDLFVTANERNLYNSITWKKPQNLGVFYGKILEAFTHRITFIRATLYPFFGVYLNMPGHSYNTIFSVFSVFWSLKIFWAFIIDANVILGKARIYYMAMGWAVSIPAYAAAVLLPYPKPFYDVTNCTLDKTVVLNEYAPSSATMYICVMSLAVLGIGVVDLTSDALVVDYTKQEDIQFRGKSNACSHICGLLGGVILYFLLGIGLNSPEYGGNFCRLSITYQHILMVYLAVSILGFFNVLFFTYEEPAKTKTSKNIIETAKHFLDFLEFRVFQRCAVMFIVVPALLKTKSSAQVKIRKNWAQVDPFMNSVSAISTSLLTAFGMYLIQKFLLQKSWVKVFAVTKLYMIGLSFLVETLTIFDIVRNQYFYFTDELFGSVAQGIAAFIMVQLAAEVSDDGLEALTFGMLMTNWSISGSLASLLGNLISSPFHVIDDQRYTRDSFEDRWMVFGSVLVATVINILAIPTFSYLCPGCREEVHTQKRELGKSRRQSRVYVVLFLLGYIFMFLYSILVMLPTTQCLTLLGGQGC